MKIHTMGIVFLIGVMSLAGCGKLPTENTTEELPEKVTELSEKQPEAEASLPKDAETVSGNAISGEIEDLLVSLTNYNKIAWDVVYSPVSYYEGVVVSAATYQIQNTDYLLIGVTNLYDCEMTFYGRGNLKDNDKQIQVSEQAIGSKNTIVRSFELLKETDCSIKWEDLDIRPTYELYGGLEYIPWEMECKELDELGRLKAGIKREDTTTFACEYYIYSNDKEHRNGTLGYVYLFLVDEDKKIIYQKYYDRQAYPFHDKNYFSDQLVIAEPGKDKVAEMVCFANPVTDRE